MCLLDLGSLLLIVFASQPIFKIMSLPLLLRLHLIQPHFRGFPLLLQRFELGGLSGAGHEWGGRASIIVSVRARVRGGGGGGAEWREC